MLHLPFSSLYCVLIWCDKLLRCVNSSLQYLHWMEHFCFSPYLVFLARVYLDGESNIAPCEDLSFREDLVGDMPWSSSSATTCNFVVGVVDRVRDWHPVLLPDTVGGNSYQPVHQGMVSNYGLYSSYTNWICCEPWIPLITFVILRWLVRMLTLAWGL